MADAALPALASDRPLVLLHGLGRTRLAMFPLAFSLRRRGYLPINVGYFGPAGLARGVAALTRTLDERLAGYAGPIDFVTHSMGGIVARAYLAQRPELTGRMVQLAPPNQGARIANMVRRVPLVGRVPALFDLGREDDAWPRHGLPPVAGYEVGVVAGRSVGPWLGEPSDGIVRVVETYLPEARDWILLPHFHTLIMNGRDTLQNVDAFLRTGRFHPEAPRLEGDERGFVLAPHRGAAIEAA